MRRYASWVVVVGLPGLLLAGCAVKRPEVREPRRPPPPPVRVEAPLAASVYVALAASTDLFEIQSAELAQARASNMGLRDFARMMVEAHKGLGSQLSFAGRRLDLLPSAELLPEHKLMLDELAASGDFDATYRRQQLKVHEAAVKLHGDYAARGTSPTLRPVAASALPVVRAHLDRLRGL